MISYTIETDVIIHNSNGAKSRKTFYCMEEDLTAAGIAFKIATPVAANDADLAVTKDTRRVLIYDLDQALWFEQ